MTTYIDPAAQERTYNLTCAANDAYFDAGRAAHEAFLTALACGDSEEDARRDILAYLTEHWLATTWTEAETPNCQPPASPAPTGALTEAELAKLKNHVLSRYEAKQARGLAVVKAFLSSEEPEAERRPCPAVLPPNGGWCGVPPLGPDALAARAEADKKLGVEDPDDFFMPA